MSEHTVTPERIFLCTEGDASKFWRVRVEGSLQTVRYGRIGTDGHELTKTFDSATLASKATDKLIREKLGKGYREVSDQESKEAHDAARPSEDEVTPATPKPRRVGKRSIANVKQLTLFLDDEEAGNAHPVTRAVLTPTVTPPPVLALDF